MDEGAGLNFMQMSCSEAFHRRIGPQLRGVRVRFGDILCPDGVFNWTGGLLAISSTKFMFHIC